MIVIKYGGHALPEPGKHDPIIKVIADYFASGNPLALVHGGGPQIDAELELHGINKVMISGYRQTTSEVFEVVQKVLSGQVLRTLVNQFISEGINAVGISAADGELIRAKKMEPIVDGEPVDIGYVGDIDVVNPKIVNTLLAGGFLPIISPIGVSESGRGFNMNADIAAGAIGGSLMANEVIFMTDVAGIYREFPNPDSIISTISAAELKVLQPSFREGMIPKVQAALYALESGAKRIRIIDGRVAENLLSALSGHGGTVVTQ